MKYLFLVIICIIAFANNTYSQKGSTQTEPVVTESTKKEDENGFKLIGGGNLGIGAYAFSFSKYTDKTSKNSQLASGLSNDLLNEFSVTLLAKFDKTFGFGTEVGRLTHFETAIGVGTSTINQYISGLYFAPFVNIGKFRVGFTYMKPSETTFFFRADNNIATDVKYSDFTDSEKEVIKKAIQPLMNLFVRYDYEATKFAGIPAVVYGKLSYDLKHPLDNGLTDKYDVQHYRVQITLGGSIMFDILK